MSKSNFSKAMKELIGINDNELEKEDEELFPELNDGIGMDKPAPSVIAPPQDSFDKERDDAAAKLRMMLNKDKEVEKKEPEKVSTAPISFAEKMAASNVDESKSDMDNTESDTMFISNDKEKTLEKTPVVTPAPAPIKPVEKTYSAEESKTVIGKGSVITGSLNTQGDIDIRGIVRGDIKTSGNVIVTGKVAGDIGSTDLTLMDTAAVQGDIMARGTASVNKDAIVIGDVTAGNINLNGKVKGNVAAREVADLSDTSVIDGNVSAASVAINPGTKLRGQISLTSASDVNDDDFIIDFDA